MDRGGVEVGSKVGRGRDRGGYSGGGLGRGSGEGTCWVAGRLSVWSLSRGGELSHTPIFPICHSPFSPYLTCPDLSTCSMNPAAS